MNTGQAKNHTGWWWADAHYLAPGIWFRQRRIVPVPTVLLRPRYWWRTRGFRWRKP